MRSLLAQTGLKNLELILTAAGLLIILVAASLATQSNRWPVAAVTATVVGVIHGILFWLVRRRQRMIREQALRDVRAMLQDVVKNQLMVIQANVHMATRAPDSDKYVGRINTTVGDISAALDSISDEALTSWQQKYLGEAGGLVGAGMR